jgi:rhodanese-related sulfurtransferase
MLLLFFSALFHESIAVHKQWDWQSLKKMIWDKFPNVQSLTTEKLARTLSSSKSEKPILLDAREREEYEVSHLKNALNATTTADALEILKNEKKNRFIVVYCSVGYRSARLIQQLKEQGFSNIYNVEGSIFKWITEGRSVFRGDKRVYNVHPYKEEWRHLLNKKYWSTEPDETPDKSIESD